MKQKYFAKNIQMHNKTNREQKTFAVFNFMVWGLFILKKLQGTITGNAAFPVILYSIYPQSTSPDSRLYIANAPYNHIHHG